MEKLKKASLLLSGFIGGVAFIVGCNGSSSNQANAHTHNTPEQMICERKYTFNTDGTPVYYDAKDSSDFLKILTGNEETRGSGTFIHGVTCTSFTELEELAFQPLQNFTSDGWFIALELEDGGLLLNRY